MSQFFKFNIPEIILIHCFNEGIKILLLSIDVNLVKNGSKLRNSNLTITISCKFSENPSKNELLCVSLISGFQETVSECSYEVCKIILIHSNVL
jgi:hypothetical protein